MSYNSLLESIKGVGNRTAEQMRSAGLDTVSDVIEFLPRTYQDYSKADLIQNLKPGKVTVRAMVESISTRYIRRNMKITTALLVDAKGDKLKAVWFNQPFREKQIKVNQEYYFYGDFALKYQQYQLLNPSCELARDIAVANGKIMPVYSMRAGLKQTTIKRVVKILKPYIKMLPEILPADVVAKANLLDRAVAMEEIHFPTDRELLERSIDRMSFEELYILILAARLNRSQINQLTSYAMPFQKQAIVDFVNQLPFKLTNAQRRTAWEVLLDMEKPVPMNRLLQGDVGSGKTVVATLAALQAALSGYQVAIMVPTEVLATQHYKTINKLLANSGYQVDILTGTIKGTKRQKLLNNLKSGQCSIIIGTHALFQDKVEFKNLGLVIIDEQHRFGVKQRQSLQAKSPEKLVPHLLSMTATPIPRSLQLTVFGDLNISTIDQLPKDRKKVNTKIILPNERRRLLERIREELDKGRQAYFVTKLITDSELSEKTSAEALYKQVTKELSGYRVGLLHGKLSSETKDSVMRKFQAGEFDILVATTVIEVGVDVPNASVMVIENADQFGLAQLHQLRGRVGRGEYESYCYLVQTDSKQPTRRLKEIAKSNDGFYLSEVDLQLRGAGEIYGTAQHGELNLRVANLADTKLIKQASDIAKQTMANINSNPDYLSNYPALSTLINKYQKLTTLN